LEIQQKQEAQRIALAHGGFADLIDFEEAVKNGAAADYHDTHGYGGMMGGPPAAKKSTASHEGTTTSSAETHEATKPVEQYVKDGKPIVEDKKQDDAVEAGGDQAQVVLEAVKETTPPQAGECTASRLADGSGDCQPPVSERPTDEL